jgi:hypothetical protein
MSWARQEQRHEEDKACSTSFLLRDNIGPRAEFLQRKPYPPDHRAPGR